LGEGANADWEAEGEKENKELLAGWLEGEKENDELLTGWVERIRTRSC
jgi:hypothetical protein